MKKNADDVKEKKDEEVSDKKGDASKSAEGSGIDVDDNIDVSDNAMARARENLEADDADDEKDDEEDKDTKNKKEKPDDSDDDDSDDKSDDADDADKLDETAEAILETFSSKEKSVKREQTPEEYVKELERKNKKLMEKQNSLNLDPAPKPQKQMTKEEYAAWVEKEFDMDMDEFDKNMRFMNRYKQEFWTPEIDSLKESLRKEKLKHTLGNNKLYKQLQDRVDELVKTDERLKTLPEDVATSIALDIAQKEYMPKLLVNERKKAQRQAKENRSVVPTDRTTVGSSKVKTEDNIIKLGSDDKIVMQKMNVTKDDIKKYQGTLELD